MRTTLVVCLLLATVALAAAPSASAYRCMGPPSNGSVVDDIREHAVEQCDNTNQVLYGPWTVADYVNYSCQFFVGFDCL